MWKNLHHKATWTLHESRHTMATNEGEDSRHDFNVVGEYRSAYQAVTEGSASI